MHLLSWELSNAEFDLELYLLLLCAYCALPVQVYFLFFYMTHNYTALCFPF